MAILNPVQENDVDFDSTLVRRGSGASRLSELIDFVDDLERRPLQKLASDLPGFMGLSGTKYDLVVQVVRRRLRKLGDADRQQFRATATKAAQRSDAVDANRLSALLDELGV